RRLQCALLERNCQMQSRLRMPTTATYVAACLGMSTWVACGNDNGTSRTDMALGQAGEPQPAAGNGSTPSGSSGNSEPPHLGGTGGAGGKRSGPGHPPKDRGGPRSTPPTRNEASSRPAIIGTASGSGCGPNVTIHFKAVVGNQDFACDASYAGQGSTNTNVKP